MAAPRPKKATIRDVAKQAGVSHMTVSRVLNETAQVTPEKVAAVRQAITETGFTASASARQLATGKAEAYGVVLTEPLDELLTDPTFASVLKGITDGLVTSPVVPILFAMATSLERAKGMRLFRRGTVDAVIHLSPYVDDGMLDELEAAQIPVVLCGQLTDRRYERTFFSVYADDVVGAKLAATHLLERGSTRIAAIMGPNDNPATPDRVAGLRSVLGDRLLPDILYSDWDIRSGYERACVLVESKERFDAIACGNDRIAVGILEALRKHSIDVPNDVNVIGFDDHPIASEANPALTTVRQPFHLQGETAVRLAHDGVAGKQPRTKILLPQIVQRESTRKQLWGTESHSMSSHA